MDLVFQDISIREYRWILNSAKKLGCLLSPLHSAFFLLATINISCVKFELFVCSFNCLSCLVHRMWEQLVEPRDREHLIFKKGGQIHGFSVVNFMGEETDLIKYLRNTGSNG